MTERIHLETQLTLFAGRLWPQLAHHHSRRLAVGRLLLLLVTVPLTMAALAWLIAISNGQTLRLVGWGGVLLLGARWGLAQFDFTAVLGLDGVLIRGALGRLVSWGAVLVFGPSVLWWDVVGLLLTDYRQGWTAVEGILVGVVRDILPLLIATALIPVTLTSFAVPSVLLALSATFAMIGLTILLICPILLIRLYVLGSSSPMELLVNAWQFGRAIFLFYALPALFGLAIGEVLVVTKWPGFVFGLTAVLLATFLLQSMGNRAVTYQQRALQRLRLIELARAVAADPTDNDDLPDLLAEYAPQIFAECQLEVRLFPATCLYASAEVGWEEALWQAIAVEPQGYFLGESVLGVAIMAVDEAHPCLGGILLSPPENSSASDWLSITQAFAEQIASAVHRVAMFQQALTSQAEVYQAEVYAQAYEAATYAEALQLERLQQELKVAGKIQASFLPSHVPHMPGWQMAVSLEAAREASGDFYDWIPLGNGRWGIVIADVADKGIGAALFMALSRTLIRTYATTFEDDPAKVLAATNRRILEDTHSDLFVTVFYAVLELCSGKLTYCNAGHNPPYLIQASNGHTPIPLKRTAMPLGLFEEVTWEQTAVTIEHGDLLLLYTDGITEAQDEEENFFGEERLKNVARTHMGRSAEIVETKIIGAVYDFVGSAPQFDDITLMVIVRDEPTIEAHSSENKVTG